MIVFRRMLIHILATVLLIGLLCGARGEPAGETEDYREMGDSSLPEETNVVEVEIDLPLYNPQSGTAMDYADSDAFAQGSGHMASAGSMVRKTEGSTDADDIDEEISRVREISYNSGRIDGYSFLYSHDMLLVNANALSTDIAKASVALAAVAYNRSGIQTLLENMDYKNVTTDNSYNEADRTIYSNDVVAYTIGTRA